MAPPGGRFAVLWAACAFAVAAATGACTGRQGIEEHRVRAAVGEYNLILPRAYALRRAELLEPCTTENERERVSTLIAALDGEGRVLDARQEQFGVESVSVFTPPRLADLVSVETWWYRHADSRTGVEVKPPQRIRYRLRYKVVQNQGRWRVDRLELLKSDDLGRAE